MNLIALLKILIATTRLVEGFILEAAERKKAGNLSEIHAAVSQLKDAKTQEERDAATAQIQSAFEKG